MDLTLLGPSEPIKVFSYFYAKNSGGEWTLPRRCRKPDLYSTDRNRSIGQALDPACPIVSFKKKTTF